MKQFSVSPSSEVFGMAYLNPKKTNLPVTIWSDHGGIVRNKSDVVPRVKIDYNDTSVSVTIEAEPVILAQSIDKQSDMKRIRVGMKYVGENYKSFLKHYNDVSGDFDDEDLFNELRSHGAYK